MDTNEPAASTDEQDTSIQSRKADIARQALDMKFTPQSTDISVSLDQAAKFPMAEIEALGVAFASLPKAVRTITVTAGGAGGNLVRVFDQLGNPLDLGILQAFNDGSGLMGSFRDAVKGFGQARLQPVSPTEAINSVTMPYDPTRLYMGMALMEINKKLDAIQETQEEMFNFIRDKDKAELRGNLETLSDVLNNYQFNWDNDQYKTNKHILVQHIRNDAEKAIIQHRAQLKRRFGNKGLFHIDNDVRENAKAIRNELEEYRLSVYLYAFSSFLEVMLLENFDTDYLSATASTIEARSLAYRELYTEAYNALESQADSSVRAFALGGLSGAMGFLGHAMEHTPVGEFTPIDNALRDAGKGIGDFNQGVKHDMMNRITDARTSDVQPFVENIQNVNRLYNESAMLLADSDTIYVLPAESVEEHNVDPSQ